MSAIGTPRFDCRPGAIAVSLALREPKYQETAAYCHFGRAAYTKDGKKFFEWENAKDLAKYKGMNTARAITARGSVVRWKSASCPPRDLRKTAPRSANAQKTWTSEHPDLQARMR